MWSRRMVGEDSIGPIPHNVARKQVRDTQKCVEPEMHSSCNSLRSHWSPWPWPGCESASVPHTCQSVTIHIWVLGGELVIDFFFLPGTPARRSHRRAYMTSAQFMHWWPGCLNEYPSRKLPSWRFCADKPNNFIHKAEESSVCLILGRKPRNSL